GPEQEDRQGNRPGKRRQDHFNNRQSKKNNHNRVKELDAKALALLLERASVRGIDLSLDQASLVLKFPKGRKPDPAFIEELKDNKEDLIAYLEDRSVLPGPGTGAVQKAKPFLYEGKEYYAVWANQHYWINDEDREHKERVSSNLSFRITGPF